ncbi:DUF4760 domain-containing protein [Streptomyces canus]|uniref:DUF4760 domain-containing protein n=1 Tax=Streptomyces canus TaxID=58343 RepID=UPI002DD9677B|nr:hypothetical protein [Streptomyces canus]WSD86678.1 hypothetical protein OG925_21285 [Streptomyces canus]
MPSLILAQSHGASSFDYLQTAAIVLGAVGVIVAMIQIRRDTHSSRQARQADLSWSMYVAYVDPAIRKARGTAEALAHSPQCPRDAQEYHETLADGSPWTNMTDDSKDADLRRLLRFYNQLSILLSKDLIDEEFVFGLIGAGLISVWPALSPAVSYYEHYFPHSTEPEWNEEPRLIYHEVPTLYERCVRWNQQRRIRT